MPTTDSFWNLPTGTLEEALDLRKQIEALRKTEQDIMGGGGSPANTVVKRRGRPPKPASVSTVTVKRDGRTGKRSAVTIAKMRAAQKARWAAKKGGDAPPAATGAKEKRTMSPEARAKIAAAQKARWAKRR
jgi:hypothetical protein